MARWTEAQVVKLAPDDPRWRLPAGWPTRRPWSDTGSTETLVWGKCQGSGTTPYQVSVDLDRAGVPVLLPEPQVPLQARARPAAALGARRRRGRRRASRPPIRPGVGRRARPSGRQQAGARTERRRPPDPAAQAKRLDDRLALMTAGLDDFARWLQRPRPRRHGRRAPAAVRLVGRHRRPPRRRPAARLAEQVRRWPATCTGATTGPTTCWPICGRWWTATPGLAARETARPRRLADLRVVPRLGRSTDEVRAADAARRHAGWCSACTAPTTAGSSSSAPGCATCAAARCWWCSTSPRGPGAGRAAQLVGTVLDGDGRPLPRLGPACAPSSPTEPVASGRETALPGRDRSRPPSSARAERLVARPWRDRVPVVLGRVSRSPGSDRHVGRRGGRPAGPDRRRPPVVPARPHRRTPGDLFGELEDGRFRPLTVAVGGGLVAL